MPDRLDKSLFLAGLGMFTMGQVALNLLGPASQDQQPIDYAHWLLLAGVILLLPYAARLPREGLYWAIGPLLVLSIVATIGMNVLDFAFWALPADLDAEFYRAVSAEPSVWWPFMRYGPNEVFVTALVLPSLMLFDTSRLGTALVIAGAITLALGTQWFNVAGYLLVIGGYYLNFDRLRPSASA